MANALTDAILSGLGTAGYVLDTPGAYLRGLLSGNPGERVSGRDMLGTWGRALGAPDDFDPGFVGGLAADIATDPFNLLGGAALGLVGKARRAALANNARRAELLATGGMPAEKAALTRVADEAGKPLRVYHGTPAAFDAYDMGKMDVNALYGPGIYTTANPEVASSYAKKGAGEIIDWPALKAEALRRQKLIDSEDLKLGERIGDLTNQIESVSKKTGLRNFDELAMSVEGEPVMRMYDSVRNRKLDLGRERLKIYSVLHGGWNDFGEVIKESPWVAGYVTPARQNVRMQFIDARKPFFPEKPYPAEELLRIEKNRPIAPDDPGLAHFYGNPKTAPGENLFSGFDKNTAMEKLRQAGYDAVFHTGGLRSSGPEHNVFIAFSPEQIYSPWVAPASAKVPRRSPLVAAILGENAMTRPPWEMMGGGP